jgi:hypothetical protein
VSLSTGTDPSTARKTGHAHSTIEHLLPAILDTPNACGALRACRVDPVILKQEFTLKHRRRGLMCETEHFDLRKGVHSTDHVHET